MTISSHKTSAPSIRSVERITVVSNSFLSAASHSQTELRAINPAHGRLVEKQERRAVEHRLRNFEAPDHPPEYRTRRPAASVRSMRASASPILAARCTLGMSYTLANINRFS